MVGHNVKFDLRMVHSNLKRIGMNDIEYITFYDTLDIARRFYPNIANHKLETLSEMFRVKTKSDHDALNDIKATKDVLISIISEKIYPQKEDRKQFIKRFISDFSKVKEDMMILENIKNKKGIKPIDLLMRTIEMYNAVNITGKNEEGEHSYKHTNNLKNFFTIYDKVDTDIEEGLLNILEYISLASRDNEELIRRRNSIPILTIHQSKGLEYDFIFFAGVQENCIPNYYSKNNSEEFDEEKRVFYVAITRAKEKLFISAPKMNLFNKPVNYSSFIDFIPSKYLI